MDSSAPSTKRQIRPSAKLGSDNGGEHQIASHRAAIDHTRKTSTDSEPPNPSSSTNASSDCGSASDCESDSVETPRPNQKRPAAIVLSNNDSDNDDNATASPSKPKPQKKKATKKRKVAADDEGGATVQSIDVDYSDSGNQSLNKTEPTADLKHFFKKVPHKKGDKRGRVECICCSASKTPSEMVEQHSAQRRHMQLKHPATYCQWAKTNNFKSMLPEDTKGRREAIAEQLVQTSVDDHFKPATPEDQPTPYTDEVFKQVAIEWLIETNQPIQAFNHTKFKKMINIASRATHGVKLPSRKQTCKEIIQQFKVQMTALKERLHGPLVGGKISLMCDSWTAGNGDGYFTVTGHWIEEVSPTDWVEREALFRFMPMNMSHSGVYLGQALYKVCNCLAVIHKIGHITCDNTMNNDTMFKEFAKCYKLKTNHIFDIQKQHIHKAKYYSADSEDGHVLDLKGHDQDEVGLVQAITVKAWSLSQHKELFKSIQIENQEPPLQLLLDMKVRWGSTYVMLLRAEKRQEEVNTFVYKLSMKETNHEKRWKIGDLSLSEDEWPRVRFFNNLLQHANEAQHAFSAATRPTLHNTLPAIEKLDAEWQKAHNKDHYDIFEEALEAAMAKLDKYYKKTAISDAHVIAMALNPAEKFEHFRKYCGKDLLKEVKDTVKKKFIECYEKIHNGLTSKPAVERMKKVSTRHNCYDTEFEEDSDEDDDPTTPAWFKEWDTYLTTHETVPEGMSIVQWWGLNAHCYLTWASLARDYLVIMALSVSSECAFSSAGITISKCRSRLKSDIVEAIECLKCLIHSELLFCEVIVIKDLEAELENTEQAIDQNHADVVTEGDGFSWDQLVEDNEDDISEDMIENLD